VVPDREGRIYAKKSAPGRSATMGEKKETKKGSTALVSIGLFGKSGGGTGAKPGCWGKKNSDTTKNPQIRKEVIPQRREAVTSNRKRT